MKPAGSFRRTTAGPQAGFYIKGSYVLDLVFGRESAQDVDVFYDRSRAAPTRASVLEWLESKGLPSAKQVDITPVDDLASCSGGEQPFFGFERWRVREDGKLYTLEETNEPSDEMQQLWGAPARKTRPRPMSREEAANQELVVLRNFDDIPADETGLRYIDKLFKKMKIFPELQLDLIAKQLATRRRIIEPPG